MRNEDDETPVWAVNIAQLAEATGLSHAELARRAGISRDAFHRYATGKTRPPVDKVYILADLFGVDDTGIDPTRRYLRKKKRGQPALASQPYIIGPPSSGDPDLIHLRLEMDIRHGTLARMLELVADERRWFAEQELKEMGDDEAGA